MTAKTWDGLPVANETPKGASVIGYREQQGLLQILILHRAHQGPDYEGDWAWTPPSGVRQPSEDVDFVAQREMLEETGLIGEPEKTSCGDARWYVYEFRYNGKAPLSWSGRGNPNVVPSGQVVGANIACNTALTGTYASDHYAVVADIRYPSVPDI